MRAACRNSCSPKNEGDFFDYYLLVCPPLELTYSLRPLTEWATSQGTAQRKRMLIFVTINILKPSTAATTPNFTSQMIRKIVGNVILPWLQVPTVPVHLDPSPRGYNLFFSVHMTEKVNV